MRVHGGGFHLPSSPDVSHPPFYCSAHCSTALLTGKTLVSTCSRYHLYSMHVMFTFKCTTGIFGFIVQSLFEMQKKIGESYSSEWQQHDIEQKFFLHLALMTLIPPTSTATPTAPTSTPRKTAVTSTTLKIQHIQVTLG